MSRPPLNDQNTEQGLVDLGSIPGLSPVAVFNLPGVENLLQTKGFRILHYQHALLPDRETLHSPDNPNTQSASLRGVMFYSVRELKSVPQKFTLDQRLTIQGLYGVGTLMVNCTGHYTDGDKAQSQLSQRDLLVFPDLTDKARQLLEWHPTGPMRAQYKIKGVDLLFDRDTFYQEGADYDIVDYKIQWRKEGRKPRMVDGKPAILSMVYWYTPIYIVQNLPHSLRVIPSNDSGHASQPREMEYAPQLAIIKPSTIMEEKDIMDWTSLPPYAGYSASKNTTGGSNV